MCDPEAAQDPLPVTSVESLAMTRSASKLCILPVLVGASLTSPNPTYDPATAVPRAEHARPRPVFPKRKTCYESRPCSEVRAEQRLAAGGRRLPRPVLRIRGLTSEPPCGDRCLFDEPVAAYFCERA